MTTEGDIKISVIEYRLTVPFFSEAKMQSLLKCVYIILIKTARKLATIVVFVDDYGAMKPQMRTKNRNLLDYLQVYICISMRGHMRQMLC